MNHLRPNISTLGHLFLSWLIFILISSSLLGADVQATTNWPSIFEILKTWEKVSIDNVTQAAEQGDRIAQHYLGYCYTEGLRVARNPSQAVTWYERAMTNGHLPAANNLGLIYQRGLLGAPEPAKAVSYYRYAADRGLPVSQANLGFLYANGEGVHRNPAEAMKWYQRAAAQGSESAMVGIGRLYRFGQGVSTDLAEAERWFQKAAQNGNGLAEVNLGLLYDSRNKPTEAFRYYQKAAEHGSTDGMRILYDCYWQGKGVAADHRKAMEFLEQVAKTSDPLTLCRIGNEFEKAVRWSSSSGGKRYTINPDLRAAFRMYLRAAELNYPHAQYHLAHFYLEGKVVVQDEARGLELIRAAADRKEPEAIRELAELYARGVGEPRDKRERPIALLESIGAWDDLAVRYEYGLGTERDVAMAAECFSKNAVIRSPENLADYVEFKRQKERPGTLLLSSKDGRHQICGGSGVPGEDVLRCLSLYLKSARRDSAAASQIADAYMTGKNCPMSVPLAWAWLNVAKQNGDTAVREQIAAVEARMSGGELSFARQRFATISTDLREVAEVLK